MRTYSKARLTALEDLKNAARGAAKMAEAALDDARIDLRNAEQFLNTLSRPNEGQLEAAQKAADDARRELARRNTAYAAACSEWTEKAALHSRAAEFIQANRLKAV